MSQTQKQKSKRRLIYRIPIIVYVETCRWDCRHSPKKKLDQITSAVCKRLFLKRMRVVPGRNLRVAPEYRAAKWGRIIRVEGYE